MTIVGGGVPQIKTENNFEINKPSTDIYGAVSMVLSGFSKPPFNEEWRINDQIVPGLVRIPELTRDLLGKLYANTEISSLNYSQKWEEGWNLPKTDILQYLDNYINHPQLEELKGLNWITEEEFNAIKQIRNSVSESPDEIVELRASYPPSKLIQSYQEESEDMRSLVILGGCERGSNSFINKRLRPGEPSNIETPRFMGRIRHIDPNTESIVNSWKEELTYYLNEREMTDYINQLNPNAKAQTIFLGEAAKVIGVPNIEGVTMELAIKYFTEVVGGKPENIPEQCLYFTLGDTKVAKHGLAALANLAIKSTIQTKYRFTEEKIPVDWQGMQLVLGKMTLNKNE